ncbi:MAG: hypothetical protein AB8G16_19545 [Gammaproteobacteria bacterium]
MTIFDRPLRGLGYILVCLTSCFSFYAAARNAPTPELTYVRHEVDANHDGIAEHIRIIQLDHRGLAIRIDNDIDGDGIADHRVGIRRDDLGRPVKIEIDVNADGSADSIEWRRYGTDGVVIEVDHDADGLIDLTRIVTTHGRSAHASDIK